MGIDLTYFISCFSDDKPMHLLHCFILNISLSFSYQGKGWRWRWHAYASIMGKLTLQMFVSFVLCILIFFFFFDGKNEVSNIIQKITFDFSKFVYQEKGIDVLDFDLYFRSLSVQNALPSRVWLF